jgi:hypothetical protein
MTETSKRFRPPADRLDWQAAGLIGDLKEGPLYLLAYPDDDGDGYSYDIVFRDTLMDGNPLRLWTERDMDWTDERWDAVEWVAMLDPCRY